MPSVTPVRSPPAAAGAALVVSPMTPSHTPGCLERRNLVIARSEHTAITPTDRARLSLLTRMLRSPLVDLYANGPQHQFAYYLIWHMFLFYMVYMYQHAECYKDRDGESNPINIGLFYACYDEILPFCLYTAVALLIFRDWRTVSRWEYVAMIVSWIKSVVVLHATVQNIKAGQEGPVKFPSNMTDYAVFGLVRFLVFGGLYKMVQAGLRRRWERSWRFVPKPKPTRITRPHGAVPVRLQRRVGPGVQRQKITDPLDTLEGRKAYWAEIRARGW